MPRFQVHGYRGGGTGWKLRGSAAVLAAALLFVLIVFLPVSPANAQVAGDSLYAMLYNGSSGDAVFMNDLKFIFRTLINDYGYTKENIIVVSYSGFAYDLDGDYQNDIDCSATRANVDSIFTVLQDIVTDGDVFFFFATDHGFKESDTPHSDCTDAGLAVFGEPDPQTNPRIFEENLQAYLDRLDTDTRRITKIIVLHTCFGGGMIPELGQLDYPVMISTAAKECEKSWHCDESSTVCDTMASQYHVAYAFHWTAAMHGAEPDGTPVDADYDNDGYVSVAEAARYAKENDEYAQETSHPREHPRYYDSNCVVGQVTTLDGTLPALPAFIAFPYPCHGPPPCRWHSWACGEGPWPSAPGQSLAGERGTVGAVAVLRIDAATAAGETTYVYADVTNPGDTPLTGAEVHFYFSDPTLSLICPQSGLGVIGTEYVPFVAPHGTVTVGPVPFVPPVDGNAFGQPYWTVMAAAEHPASPIESGWLSEDNHVAATNRFELRSTPGVPDTIQLVARNALGAPVKALLSLDDTHLPAGWSVSMSPAAGDTVSLGAGSWTPVEVILTGTDGGPLEGFVDIAMDLNTTDLRECETCEDSICGGYIGLAGGCSIKLVVEEGVPVFIPEFVAAPSGDGIAMRWRTAEDREDVSFNVYRSEKPERKFVRLNEAPIVGAGWLSYVDRTAASGVTYLYRVGAVVGDSEVFSLEVEATLEKVFEFDLEQNYPNPFNPLTTIRFSLAQTGPITVRIYDTEGRLVKTLFEGTERQGRHSLTWNSRNDAGHDVASGVYFYRLVTKEFTQTRKMVLLR